MSPKKEPTLAVTPEAQAAIDAHDIAEGLRYLRADRGPARALAVAFLVVGIIIAAALIVLVSILGPIRDTAKKVDKATNKEAQAAQAEATKAILVYFGCTQRENQSESRVMSGLEPLPLRPGCPPYNFDPNAPITLTGTTTTTTP